MDIKGKIKKIIFQIHKIEYKTIYTLNEIVRPSVKIKKNQVNLVWWNKKENLGDYLAVVVYDWMIQKFNLPQKPAIGTKYIMTIGSVLAIGVKDLTVWGSGILGVEQIPLIFRKSYFRKFDIRAVRGPLTRHVLISAGYECPEVYGDPAIIMPCVYCPQNQKKKHEISVVEHFSKSKQMKQPNLHYINIETYNYKYFIDEICASDKIVSSSLHGIILAETYGVPAVFLSDGMEDQLFKFWDWYLSTGRTDIRVAKTLEEALEMEPMPLPQLDEMRDKLITCFPVDLWKED